MFLSTFLKNHITFECSKMTMSNFPLNENSKFSYIYYLQLPKIMKNCELVEKVWTVSKTYIVLFDFEMEGISKLLFTSRSFVYYYS